MFKGLLGSKKAVLGLCLNEVGNSDELLAVKDRKRVNDVIEEAFAAPKIAPPQIICARETIKAWARFMQGI